MTKADFQEIRAYVEHNIADQRSRRGRVPYTQHPLQGAEYLEQLGADYEVCAAFVMHPLTQASANLSRFFELMQPTTNILPWQKLSGQSGLRIGLLLGEYRATAHICLSDTPNKHSLAKEITSRLTLFPDVRLMLVADKVQNTANFLLLAKDGALDLPGEPVASTEKHRTLRSYFEFWLFQLSLTEAEVALASTMFPILVEEGFI